jgi:amino acid transporter
MLPFPSWSAMIKVVSAALVLSYAVAPVTVAALRRSAPAMPRPFRVRGFGLLGPLSFVVAALIVYWSGWDVLCWLLGLQVVLFAVYVAHQAWRHVDRHALARDVRCASWLIGFYLLMMVASWLGSFGGRSIVDSPWDSLLAAAIALVAYYCGERTGLPASQIALGAEDGD